MEKKPPAVNQTPPMKSFLLVDAHNAIFAQPDLAALHRRNPAAAREKFLRLLEQLQDAGETRVVAIFDGTLGGNSTGEFSGKAGVQVFYAGAGHSADTIMERLIAKYASTRRLTVTTNDHLLRTAAEAAGGLAISVEQLFDDMERAEKQLEETLGRLRRRR